MWELCWGKKKAKTPWNLDSELNQSQAALKCKSLANFLTSSIMIFIYGTYCAARINFTLSKILFLRQIFNFLGFHLPFPSPICHTELPTSELAWAGSPSHTAVLWQSYLRWQHFHRHASTVRTSTFHVTLASHHPICVCSWRPPHCLTTSLKHSSVQDTHPLISPSSDCFATAKRWGHDKEAATVLPYFKRQCHATNNPSHLSNSQLYKQ